jgi:(heptosyl)LPS beta-1,4-glucosyltransferase
VGGFVIHGDAGPTLGRCLDALLAVCDEVVAVDSGSADGSAEVARARGVRRLEREWEGYGAARAAAVTALAGCDRIFFLDSDEWMEPEAIARFRAWREEAPAAPLHTVVRRDWADLPAGRFLFASEPHVRLLRPDRATWTPRMIVHEALPRRGAARSGVVIEHDFARSLEAFAAKEERYALLWALQAHAEGRRPKWPALQAPAHALRLALLKGALLRGGSAGWRLAWGFGRYHARKHELLADLWRGAHAELVRALDEGRLSELYRSLPARGAVVA